MSAKGPYIRWTDYGTEGPLWNREEEASEVDDRLLIDRLRHIEKHRWPHGGFTTKELREIAEALPALIRLGDAALAPEPGAVGETALIRAANALRSEDGGTLSVRLRIAALLEARAALAASPELEMPSRARLGQPEPGAGGEWQPIETAPKGEHGTGPRILLWDTFSVFEGFWNGGAFVTAERLQARPHVNHWRPLPAPPLAAAPQQGGDNAG